MGCGYEEYLNDFLNGKLSESKIEELKKHAEKCESCSNELKKIYKIDEFIKNNLTTYPYKSNKNKILNKVKKYNTNKKVIKLMIYRFKKPACIAAAILILTIGMYKFTTLANSIFNNTKTELSTKIVDGNYYIGIKNNTKPNVAINKLYPSYVPNNMDLSTRYLLGDKVDMQFNYLREKDDVRTIGLNITSQKPSYWKEEIQGKPIQNSNGQWLLNIETKGYSMGKLYFKLNDNIYVTIQTNNIPKEEIIKFANSIKETNKYLKNDVNDQTIVEMLGPKLMGNKAVTIREAIQIVKKLGLKCDVEVKTSEYDNKLKTFLVKDGVVTLR